jgi:hypothetical protein
MFNVMVIKWKNGDVTRHELKTAQAMSKVLAESSKENWEDTASVEFCFVTPEKVTVLGIWTNYESAV